MKLFRVKAGVGRSDPAKWVASKAAASSARKEFTIAGYKRDLLQTDEFEVPANKAGLLEFLNKEYGL